MSGKQGGKKKPLKGNLESDLQAGAYAGYSLIWVLFWATVIGLILQIMAARLGVVTGRSLAEQCRLEYPRPVSLVLWLMTEIAIIASDIQEVIGSAIAFKILFGLPLWAGSVITGLDTFSFLALHAFGVRKLEAFFCLLIGTMCACFFVDFAKMNPSGSAIMGGFEPYVPSYAGVQAVGILGAVVMPHNIYLHSALVQSRNVDRTRPAKVREANKYFAIEAAIALFVSFLINLAVVAVFSKGFFDPACAVQQTALVDGVCKQIGLLDAGDALHGVLGSAARQVWAVGLLAAGQSSTMTGTYAGQFVMEGFLQLKMPAWKRVALTRSIALVPAVLVSLASNTDSNSGDQLDEWLNILQSVQLPFALLPVLHFTSSKRTMGSFANHKAVQALVWALAALALCINVYLVSTFVTDPDQPSPHEAWFYAVVCVIAVAYFGFIAYIVKEDIKRLRNWFRNNFGRTDEASRHLLSTDDADPSITGGGDAPAPRPVTSSAAGDAARFSPSSAAAAASSSSSSSVAAVARQNGFQAASAAAALSSSSYSSPSSAAAATSDGATYPRIV